MKKTALIKNAIREIWNSKARFLSILGIIFLGVAFFSGIKATGPNMEKTANTYFAKQNLSDLTLQSTLGLTAADLKIIADNAYVEKVEVSQQKDLVLPKNNEVVRLYGLDDQDTLNSYVVVSGRLPKNDTEIALDNRASLKEEYKISETVTLAKDDDLTQTELTIVGFVNRPNYIENVSRGNTTVGKGAIDYFAVTGANIFKSSAIYPSLEIQLKDMPTDTYSTAYATRLKKAEASLKEDLAARPEARLQEIKDEAATAITDGQQKIDDGYQALSDANEKLVAAKKKLADGQTKMTAAEATLQTQLAEGKEKLAATEAQLTAAEEKIAAAQKEISTKEATLAASQKELADKLTTFQQKKADWEAMRPQAQASLTQLEAIVPQLTDATTQLQTILAQTDETIVAQGLTVFATTVKEQLAGHSELAVYDSYRELLANIETVLATPTREAGVLLQTSLTALTTELANSQSETAVQIKTADAEIAAGQAQLTQAQTQLDAGAAAIAAGKTELATQSATVANGRTQLAAGKSELETQEKTANAELATQKQKLADAQKTYDEGLATYQKEEQENLPALEKAQAELTAKQKDLDAMSVAEYLYSARADNPGYSEFSDNAKRITNIATVFPVLFFLIAALISFTTMTRMVEEKRGEIGTLKALGYRNGEIAQKYLIYAGLSAVVGGVLGIVIGNLLFPTMIFNAYGALYNLPSIVIAWYPLDIFIAMLVALVCTVGSSLVVLRVDLFNVPAVLMRPKAPKAGKRLVLERVKFIWSRLSFIQKVTVRNLFRYKARALMTILGIAGCMSLMLTGFGLRDSIGDIVGLQFGKLWHYQAVVTFNDTTTKADDEAYEQSLSEVNGLNSAMPVASLSFTMEKSGVNTQDVTLYAPEKPTQMADFILFNSRQSKKVYKLTDEGAIINEKLAKLFDIKQGDTVAIKNSDGETYKVKVAAIVENYLSHYLYVTPTYYEKIFGQEPVYNTQLLLFDELPKDEDAVADKLMADKKVLNVSFMSTMSSAMSDTMSSLNIVVWVLIVSAALLAFIVLYNLTNINISERIRELSTIKVLGFYNPEVTMYIYRENLFLTLFGIIFGGLLGIAVHKFVLQTVEVDLIMFGPNIHWLSFVYASLLTIFFTLLVMFFMHRKLRKVDMIEALKSNE